MEKRKLGRSGLEFPPLALGGNVFGWTADEATSHRLLDAFVAAGFSLVDTADMYSTWAPGHRGGESETVIGSWLKRPGNRDRVLIATKVGAEMPPHPKGLPPAHIRRSVEESLRRLQTDHIDLYQSHYDDPATPQEATLGAYARLIEQGKIRAIGASNFTAERLASALAISARDGLPRYESLQPHYNLCERPLYEPDLEPLCRKEGLGVLPYWSLASGFLTGKYRSEADLGKSPRGAGLKKYLDVRGLRILTALDAVAARHRATPAAIALAWLIARPSVTAPIASATSPAQLETLIKGAEIKLDAASIAELDRASGSA
jgi:aryl-alcohol dehydrogenase-like predicted oxidoreductase